jgi:hypothetical protein
MSILDENIGQSNKTEGVRVTGEMKRNWIITSKWAMFFAIFGFIYIGLSVLAFGTMGSAIQTLMTLSDNPFLDAFGPLMSYFTAFMVIMLAVWFFINFYHLRFANYMQRAVNFTDQDAFEKSWLNLRNHFRLFGIVVVAVLVLYALMLVVALSLGASQTLPIE